MSPSTIEQARAAGYAPPRGVHATHRGFEIASRDVSGPHSQGYAFALVVRRGPLLMSDAAEGLGDLRNREFGRTESLWLPDSPNRLRKPGCFAVLFAPDVLASGIEAAKTAIDRWYEASPIARAEQEGWDAWRAATDARQLARAAARDARRAGRM